MKKSKLLKALCGVCAVGMMLTACGGTTTESTPADASGSQAASTGKTLTYWSMWNSTEGQAKVIQEAADAYEAATGIKINIEWKGRDVKNLIAPALDAGEKIDIFDQDYVFISNTASKYAADVTQMVADAGLEEHMLPVLVETAKSYNDGALKVIPYQPYTSGVWYNKAMFEAAGIENVPTTFDELLDVCEALKASGVNPMTCDQGDGTALLVGYQLARYLGQDGVLDIAEIAVLEHGADQSVHRHVQVRAGQVHITEDGLRVLVEGCHGEHPLLCADLHGQAGVHPVLKSNGASSPGPLLKAAWTA